MHLHGVLWPNFWSRNEVEEFDGQEACYRDFSRTARANLLLKNKFMVSTDIMYHVATLCTFGICSPFLAAIIVFCFVAKLLIWVVMLGRYLSLRSHPQQSSYDVLDSHIKETSEVELSSLSFGRDSPEVTKVEKFTVDFAVVALSECCISLLKVFDVTLWPIIWTSAFFFATLTFDIAADELVSVIVHIIVYVEIM
jgi:hypothetical protein